MGKQGHALALALSLVVFPLGPLLDLSLTGRFLTAIKALLLRQSAIQSLSSHCRSHFFCLRSPDVTYFIMSAVEQLNRLRGLAEKTAVFLKDLAEGKQAWHKTQEEILQGMTPEQRGEFLMQQAEGLRALEKQFAERHGYVLGEESRDQYVLCRDQRGRQHRVYLKVDLQEVWDEEVSAICDSMDRLEVLLKERREWDPALLSAQPAGGEDSAVLEDEDWDAPPRVVHVVGASSAVEAAVAVAHAGILPNE